MTSSSRSLQPCSPQPAACSPKPVARLLLLLLLRLRCLTEKNARSYRTAVNATLPLFELRETRLLFLIVVREFFYFWIGDPEAPSHLILDEMQE